MTLATWGGLLPPDDRDEEDQPWWRQRRWVIAVILITVFILIGAILIVVHRAAEAARPRAAVEAGTDVRLSAVDPGTAVLVSAKDLPRTTLRVTGRGAVKPQTVVVLPGDVMFDFDQSGLRPQSAPVLNQLADLILASSDGSIDVTGYADAKGTEQYNLDLSRQRAEAVIAYLVERGVAADRLRAQWRGESEPAAPNSGLLGGDNPTGRAENRRVEVVLDESSGTTAATPASRLGSDNHPDGVSLAVDALTVGPKGFVVDARILNQAAFPVELGLDPMWVVDDLGFAYRLQPTWQNPQMSVASGAAVSAQLAFLGMVPPQATAFTLMTNVADPSRGVDTSRRSAGDNTPSLLVERIPRG